MAVLDGGNIPPYAGEVLDGGSVSATPASPAPEVPVAYGVSVQHVRELATHIGFDPSHADPDFGPTKQAITDAQILHWITLVADSVASRITALSRYSAHTERWAGITGSARTAVTNGAASYLVAAAYPGRASTNDQTGYSAELWRRYEHELQFLTELPERYAAEDETGGGPDGTGGRIRSSARPAYITDDSTLFRPPAPYAQTDPARYAAPGSEGPYGYGPYRRW